MAGDDRGRIEDLDRGGRQPHRQPATGVAGRDRVVALPHRDPGPVVDPGLQQPGRVERLGRQRPQRRQLGGERGADRDRPAGDHPGLVKQVTGRDQRVQLGQRRDVRDRDEVTAPEPADLALDAALLVRAFDARSAEERVEAVVAAQRDEPLRLVAVASPQHPHHGGFEVVVTDPARAPPRNERTRAHALVGTPPAPGWRTRHGTPAPSTTAASRTSSTFTQPPATVA